MEEATYKIIFRCPDYYYSNSLLSIYISLPWRKSDN